MDANGDVFIADTNNNVIREVKPDGTIVTFAGDGTPSDSGDGGAAMAAGLNYPTSVAVDAQGNLFIADYNSAAVREVAADGVISTYFGGSSFDPAYIAIDTRGNLVFSDLGSVWERLPDGTVSRVIVPTSEPSGVAVDSAGDLFVADDGSSEIHEVSGGALLDVQA